MKYLDPIHYYTVRELSIITGVEFTRFYAYSEKLDMQKYILPSGRTGYGVHFRKFEEVLEENKSFKFDIPEDAIYLNKKRPIIRQFFDVNELHHFMQLLDDPLSIHTVKRRLREHQIQTYTLERKYLVPIISIIQRYVLPIDEQLDSMIGEVIKERYHFRR